MVVGGRVSNDPITRLAIRALKDLEYVIKLETFELHNRKREDFVSLPTILIQNGCIEILDFLEALHQLLGLNQESDKE